MTHSWQKKPVLLLNTSILPIRYITRQVSAAKLPGNLPTEIWSLIINQLIESCKPKYKAVRPISVSSTPRGQILYCRGVRLCLGEYEEMVDENAVINAEEFLQSPHSFEEKDKGRRKGEEEEEEEERVSVFAASDTDCAYGIMFLGDNNKSSVLRTPDCLFKDITVPDVITFLNDGCCWVCDGKQGICPGRTG